MQLRSDYSIPYMLDTNALSWQSSPTPLVTRKILDRVGDEVSVVRSRVTMIDKYQPNATFTSHMHEGGEEVLVLDGELIEHVTDPSTHNTVTRTHRKYTYIRNPIGSSHAPSASTEGCVLFVKLHQMANVERSIEPLIIPNLAEAFNWKPPESNPQREILELYRNEITNEIVWMERWPKDAFIEWTVGNSEEIFMLEGEIEWVALDKDISMAVDISDAEKLATSPKESLLSGDIQDNDTQSEPPQSTIVTVKAEGGEGSGTCCAHWWIRRPTSWSGRTFHARANQDSLIFCKGGHLAMLITADALINSPI